ncbi:MAG: TlpA family protein disulfide reductase [Acidobacteria bacterium]|nr:TlpA family protein disulfide reductase [Acidobacteriota bacterium]
MATSNEENDEIGGGSMVKAGRTNRWTLPAVVALGIVTAVATALSATAQEPDDRLAIDFHATRLDGTLFNGATLEGQVVLLDFWAVWCRPCIEAFPTLNHLAEKLADHDVALIGVAVHSGSPEEVADFLEEHDIQFLVVVADEALVYRLDVIGYPTYLLVGPDGAVAKRYVGALSNLTDRIMRDVMMLQQSPSAP